MKSGIRQAMFRRDDMKGWPEAKKVWVRQEARRLAARGTPPSAQELGLEYDIRNKK